MVHRLVSRRCGWIWRLLQRQVHGSQWQSADWHIGRDRNPRGVSFGHRSDGQVNSPWPSQLCGSRQCINKLWCRFRGSTHWRCCSLLGSECWTCWACGWARCLGSINMEAWPSLCGSGNVRLYSTSQERPRASHMNLSLGYQLPT
jgi:hypothetical protein